MTGETARCASCGAILSRYRAAGEPEGLCAACAPPTAPECVLAPDALVYAIAGLLLTGWALHRGRVHLQADLAALGIVADAVDVNKAVGKLRRRYRMRICAVEREPGYELIAWPYRFTRRRSLPRGRLRDAELEELLQLELALLESAVAGA
jgi:hypothetical protein